MIAYKDLAQAAFDNDSRASEGVDLSTIASGLGFVVNDLHREAEQRALRIVIRMRGPEEHKRIQDQAWSDTPSVEELTDEESKLLKLLRVAWVDGGLVAAQAARSKS